MGKKDALPVRQEITRAFMELMTKKSYMDITVTDIVNEAQVARVSFYRHFNSISDVIDCIVEDMSQEFVTDIFPILTGTDERKWRQFLFEYFYRFAKLQRAIASAGIQNISVILLRLENKMQAQESLLTPGTMRERYAFFGKMGLINSIAKKWMDNGMQETPEEMIDYIMSFITLF